VCKMVCPSRRAAQPRVVKLLWCGHEKTVYTRLLGDRLVAGKSG
jgi:hypothetical protein